MLLQEIAHCRRCAGKGEGDAGPAQLAETLRRLQRLIHPWAMIASIQATVALRLVVFQKEATLPENV
jgi:hypothetical protein